MGLSIPALAFSEGSVGFPLRFAPSNEVSWLTHSSLARHFVESDGDRQGFAAVHVRTAARKGTDNPIPVQIILSRAQIPSIKGTDYSSNSTDCSVQSLSELYPFLADPFSSALDKYTHSGGFSAGVLLGRPLLKQWRSTAGDDCPGAARPP